MPLLAASKKAFRQNSKQASRNRFFRVAMKNSIKSFADCITMKDIKKAQALLTSVYVQVDKAVKKHIIHANRGARIKHNAAIQLVALTKTQSGNTLESNENKKKESKKKAPKNAKK